MAGSARTFEWHDTKGAANLAKHGISFEAAIKVFGDPDAVTLQTLRIVDREARFKTIGRIEGKIYTVIYTRRGDAYRLISARRSNAKEDRAYAAHS